MSRGSLCGRWLGGEDAGAARGGLDSLKEKGFEPTPEEAPAAAVVWLATTPEAEAFLGRVIWTPKLVQDLSLLR